MPKSIFSSRYDKNHIRKNEIWMDLYRKSRLLPKITNINSSTVTTPTENTRTRSIIRQSLPSLSTSIKIINKSEKNFKILRSCDSYDSARISITDRYELEKLFGLQLLERYNEEKTISDEENEVEYFTNDDESHESLISTKIFDTTKTRKYNLINKKTTMKNSVKLLEHQNEIDSGEEEIKIRSENKKVKKRTHYKLNDEKFECSTCKRVFERPWILRGHIRTHTGEKPFKCPVDMCKKAFADRSNLRAHQRSKKHHAWGFECGQCTKPFSLQSSLNRHSLSACRKYLSQIRVMRKKE